MTRLSQVIALLVAMTCLGQSLVVAQPTPRDDWMAMESPEGRYGYLHTVVEQLPNGNFRYDIEIRTLVDVFGVQKQEIRQTMQCEITPTYQLVSLSTEAQLASGTVLVEVTQDTDNPGTYHVVEQNGSERTTSTLELDLNGVVDHCLIDWVREHRNDTTASEVSIIDTTMFAMDAVTLTPVRSDSGTVWNILHSDAATSGTYHADESGTVTQIKYDVPAVLLVRRTAEEAQDIEHREMTGREVLDFPVKIDMPRPDRLKEVVVKLTWRDIPLDDFELDAWTQSFETHETDGTTHVATVRVHSRALPETTATRLATGDASDPLLAETAYLKPHDEAIRAVVEDVVGDEQDAMAIVEALTAWTFNYVEGTMIAETLTGPQVLERKVGKCTEYSTLFGSLARSAGIPTRLALGERLVGDRWMGHMWNEVFVGEWIPVDASANEIGGSCSLLKFIHSDTVDGTQGLRWALTESLDIDVVSFEAHENTLATKFTTGVVGRVYTNAEAACRITAPHDDWLLSIHDEPGASIVRFSIPERDEVHIHFLSFPLPAGTKPQAIATSRLGMLRGVYSTLEVTANEARKIAGIDGHVTTFDHVNDNIETPLRTSEFVWIQGANGYLMNIIAPTAAHDEFIADVEATLATFEVLGTQ